MANYNNPAEYGSFTDDTIKLWLTIIADVFDQSRVAREHTKPQDS